MLILFNYRVVLISYVPTVLIKVNFAIQTVDHWRHIISVYMISKPLTSHVILFVYVWYLEYTVIYLSTNLKYMLWAVRLFFLQVSYTRRSSDTRKYKVAII
jgi:hypothetical protein